MSGAKGFVAGALALTFADAVLSSRAAEGRAAGAIGSAANLVAAFLDPDKPAVPDRRQGSSVQTPGELRQKAVSGQGVPATSGGPATPGSGYPYPDVAPGSQNPSGGPALPG